MKGNLKIMKTKPEITDEEIREYMNFDRLLSEHRAGLSKTKSGGVKLIATGALVIVLSALVYWYAGKEKDTEPSAAEVEKQSVARPFEKKEPEKMRPSEKKELPQQSAISRDNRKEKSSPGKEKQKAKSDSGSVMITPAYLEAEPVDGFPQLYEYFDSELTYPAAAVKDSLQGIVTVNFIINKEGKPEDIRVIHSLGPLFDKEALRLIEQMPAWKPARMNGQPVRAKISLPLTFRIEKIKDE